MVTFFGRIYVTKCSQEGAGRDTRDAERGGVAGLQNGLRKAPEGAAAETRRLTPACGQTPAALRAVVLQDAADILMHVSSRSSSQSPRAGLLHIEYLGQRRTRFSF